MRKIARTLLLVVFAIAVSTAFTAQASRAASHPWRGEGVGVLSGYRISGLHFLLSSAPGEIEQVEFDLDAPARQVQVSFGARQGIAFPCQLVSGRHWHCPLMGVEVGVVDHIRVTAVGG